MTTVPQSLMDKLGTPAYQSEEYVGFIHCYDSWASMVWKRGSRYARCQNCGLRIMVEGLFKHVPSIIDRQTKATRPDWKHVMEAEKATAYHYLCSRGLSSEEVNEHFCTDPNNPAYVIAPCEQDGCVVQWHGRRLRPGKPKYISGSTADGWMSQTEVVWGIDRVIPDQPVYVCEGIFDALYFPTGVAVLGSNVTADKAVKLLDRCPSRVVLCMDRIMHDRTMNGIDGEELGENSDKEWDWMQAFQCLDVHMNVQVMYPPEGSKDFGEQLTKRRYGCEE